MTRFAGKFVRNDKGLAASSFASDKKRVVRRLLRRVFYTARNDNLCASGKKPRARTIRKKPRARFVGKCLFAIKRFVDDFCEAKITFPYETSFCKFFCFF
jgi:hypothetical protein